MTKNLGSGMFSFFYDPMEQRNAILSPKSCTKIFISSPKGYPKSHKNQPNSAKNQPKIAKNWFFWFKLFFWIKVIYCGSKSNKTVFPTAFKQNLEKSANFCKKGWFLGKNPKITDGISWIPNPAYFCGRNPLKNFRLGNLLVCYPKFPA